MILRYAVAFAFLGFTIPALAGPKEFNAALQAAREAHVAAVSECKTLPVKIDVEVCTNRADQKLAEAGKMAKAKHLATKTK
jgi:hypothetical protein